MCFGAEIHVGHLLHITQILPDEGCSFLPCVKRVS
jgi:hypothetical protein